jgi:hypothetical protein
MSPSTFKTTLKFQDWQATEDGLLHVGRARKLGVDLAEAARIRDESTRYEVVFIEARNEHHARRAATEDRAAGWSILDIERMDW